MNQEKIIKRETLPTGKIVDYTDCIHHTTRTKFPFWQRLKHLFGAPVVIESKIFCENIPGHIKTEARGVHTRIFKKKGKGRGYCMPDNINSRKEHEQYLIDIGVTKKK